MKHLPAFILLVACILMGLLLVQWGQRITHLEDQLARCSLWDEYRAPLQENPVEYASELHRKMDLVHRDVNRLNASIRGIVKECGR